MYDVGGIKSLHASSLPSIRVKGGESECFSVDIGVRQGCIMFPWIFNVYMDAVMKEVKMRKWRKGVIFQEEGKEWRLPERLYADDFV